MDDQRLRLIVEAFDRRCRLLRQLYAAHPWTKAAWLHLLADEAISIVMHDPRMSPRARPLRGRHA